MPWRMWENGSGAWRSKDVAPVCATPDCKSSAYGDGYCLKCLQDKDRPIQEMSRRDALSLDEHHACN